MNESTPSLLSPPSLLLCADSGPGIGIGHVSRCVAFAEEATARGWRTSFAGRADWLGTRLDELGVNLLPPAANADELAARLASTRAGVVLVDDYRIAGDIGAAARYHAALLVSMTDGNYGRRRADVLVDCGLDTGLGKGLNGGSGADSAVAPPRDDGVRVTLRGPRFAPLRSVVRAARAQRSSAPPTGRPPRVAVVVGGGSWSDATGALLTALRDTGAPMDTIAVGSSPVTVPAALPGQRITTSGPRADLPELFAEADLVVSASGVTLLELCCIGVPMALVLLADNQEPGYRAAIARGVAAGLGTAADLIADSEPAVRTLHELLVDPDARARLAASAATEVDGAGAGRVLDVTSAVATVTPREATAADADLLLGWRNDTDTRAWSRSRTPVDPADHLGWLNSVLASDDRLLLVIESAESPLGTVRFDRLGDRDWEVSITVAPQHRGNGLAAMLLAAGEAELAGRAPHATVSACVHRDNSRSAALFRRAGYTEQPDRAEDGFRWLVKPLD